MSAMRKVILAGALAFACASAGAAESATQWVERADAYWANGKVEQAQKAFEAALALEPENVTLLLRLAGFQLAQQQSEASIANYRKVIAKDAANSKAWIGLGMAYLHSSRPAMARAAFAEAMRVDPTRKEKLQPLLAKLDERSN